MWRGTVQRAQVGGGVNADCCVCGQNNSSDAAVCCTTLGSRGPAESHLVLECCTRVL